MAIEINTIEDERTYNSYLAARDAPRLTMAHGVYPNAVKALAEYDSLIARLTGGDLQPFNGYHANVTAPVEPHVQTLYTAMRVIVTTLQAIESASPGTFGIQLPQVQEEQSNNE